MTIIRMYTLGIRVTSACIALVLTKRLLLLRFLLNVTFLVNTIQRKRLYQEQSKKTFTHRQE